MSTSGKTHIDDSVIDYALIIGQHARESFEEWCAHHTLENRTPREMYYFGYYKATYARWQWTDSARRENDGPTKGTSTGREPVSESHVQQPEIGTTSVKPNAGDSRVPMPDMRSVASHDKSEAQEQQE